MLAVTIGDMNQNEKRLCRNISIVLIATYPFGVGIGTLWKLYGPFNSQNSSWPEIFYGPAITAASAALFIVGVTWLVGRIHR